jgi:hypothetical protein
MFKRLLLGGGDFPVLDFFCYQLCPYGIFLNTTFPIRDFCGYNYYGTFFSYVRSLSYLIINKCLSLLRDTTPLTHHSTSVQFPPYADQLIRRRPYLIPLLPQAQPTRMLRPNPIPERPLIGEVGTWSQRPTTMVSMPDPRCTPRCDDQRLNYFAKMFYYCVDATALVA